MKESEESGRNYLFLRSKRGWIGVRIEAQVRVYKLKKERKKERKDQPWVDGRT